MAGQFTGSIDSSRLQQSIDDLGRVGSYLDERTGLRGVQRLALTDAEALGRRRVMEWMIEVGLRVQVDRIGNVYAWRDGLRPELSPVLIGSHIDSVRTGGRYDGCLGVLAGLEIVRVLKEAGRQTARTLGVAFFTDEEGARFGTDMLGSAVATGRIPLEQALALRDAAGVSVEEELRRHGFLGETPERIASPHAYLELHIEQGPVLRAAGVRVGVVSGVQAISWQELSIAGKSAHAGTTPMELRSDAGLAAARVQVELRRMIDSGDFGAMRATMGVCELDPGLVNVVPGRCRATVDLRNLSDADMRKAEAHLRAFLGRIADEEKVEIHARQTARTETVWFDESIRGRLAGHAEALGLSYQSIVSGAGHDAQEFARICPAAMVFCPGEYDGISHNPREHSTEQQCSDGANLLLRMALELLEEGESPL